MLVGSHGMDHRPWPELDDDALKYELGESKKALEDLCGYEMRQAGLPFGLYNKRVIAMLGEFGFTTIYSSDGSQKFTGKLPVPRFSVRSDTSLESLERMMIGSSLSSRILLEIKSRIKASR